MSKLLLLSSEPTQRVLSRPVPPEWRQQLADAYPPDAPNGFPWLVWEPGYDWILEGNTYDEIVERWMLYWCQPIETMNPFGHGQDYNLGILKELKGPPPESLRIVSTIAGRMVRIIPGTVITQRTWEVFHETGCYGRPIWCVQGPNGGTPMAYPVLYQARAKINRLPTTPPMPGTLPYADFDNRVLASIAQYETIRERAWDVRKRKRTTGSRNRENEAKCVAMVDAWLQERVAAYAADIAPILPDADLPVTTTDWDRKLDEANAASEAATHSTED